MEDEERRGEGEGRFYGIVFCILDSVFVDVVVYVFIKSLLIGCCYNFCFRGEEFEVWYGL